MVGAAVPSSYTIVFQFRAETLLPTTGTLSAPYKYNLGAVSDGGLWCCRSPEMRLKSTLCLKIHKPIYNVCLIACCIQIFLWKIFKISIFDAEPREQIITSFISFFFALHVIIIHLLIIVFSTLA